MGNRDKSLALKQKKAEKGKKTETTTRKMRGRKFLKANNLDGIEPAEKVITEERIKMNTTCDDDKLLTGVPFVNLSGHKIKLPEHISHIIRVDASVKLPKGLDDEKMLRSVCFVDLSNAGIPNRRKRSVRFSGATTIPTRLSLRGLIDSDFEVRSIMKKRTSGEYVAVAVTKNEGNLRRSLRSKRDSVVVIEDSPPPPVASPVKTKAAKKLLPEDILIQEKHIDVCSSNDDISEDEIDIKINSKRTSTPKRPKRLKGSWNFKMRVARNFTYSEHYCDECNTICKSNVDLQIHILHRHIQRTVLKIPVFAYKLPAHFVTTYDEDKYLKPHLKKLQLSVTEMKDLVGKYSEEAVGVIEESFREDRKTRTKAERKENTETSDVSDANDGDDGDSKTRQGAQANLLSSDEHQSENENEEDNLKQSCTNSNCDGEGNKDESEADGEERNQEVDNNLDKKMNNKHLIHSSDEHESEDENKEGNLNEQSSANSNSDAEGNKDQSSVHTDTEDINNASDIKSKEESGEIIIDKRLMMRNSKKAKETKASESGDDVDTSTKVPCQTKTNDEKQDDGSLEIDESLEIAVSKTKPSRKSIDKRNSAKSLRLQQMKSDDAVSDDESTNEKTDKVLGGDEISENTAGETSTKKKKLRGPKSKRLRSMAVTEEKNDEEISEKTVAETSTKRKLRGPKSKRQRSIDAVADEKTDEELCSEDISENTETSTIKKKLRGPKSKRQLSKDAVTDEKTDEGISKNTVAETSTKKKLRGPKSKRQRSIDEITDEKPDEELCSEDISENTESSTKTKLRGPKSKRKRSIDAVTDEDEQNSAKRLKSSDGETVICEDSTDEAKSDVKSQESNGGEELNIQIRDKAESLDSEEICDDKKSSDESPDEKVCDGNEARDGESKSESGKEEVIEQDSSREENPTEVSIDNEIFANLENDREKADGEIQEATCDKEKVASDEEKGDGEENAKAASEEETVDCNGKAECEEENTNTEETVDREKENTNSEEKVDCEEETTNSEETATCEIEGANSEKEDADCEEEKCDSGEEQVDCEKEKSASVEEKSDDEEEKIDCENEKPACEEDKSDGEQKMDCGKEKSACEEEKIDGEQDKSDCEEETMDCEKEKSHCQEEKLNCEESITDKVNGDCEKTSVVDECEEELNGDDEKTNEEIENSEGKSTEDQANTERVENCEEIDGDEAETIETMNKEVTDNEENTNDADKDETTNKDVINCDENDDAANEVDSMENNENEIDVNKATTINTNNEETGDAINDGREMENVTTEQPGSCTQNDADEQNTENQDEVENESEIEQNTENQDEIENESEIEQNTENQDEVENESEIEATFDENVTILNDIDDLNTTPECNVVQNISNFDDMIEEDEDKNDESENADKEFLAENNKVEDGDSKSSDREHFLVDEYAIAEEETKNCNIEDVTNKTNENEDTPADNSASDTKKKCCVEVLKIQSPNRNKRKFVETPDSEKSQVKRLKIDLEMDEIVNSTPENRTVKRVIRLKDSFKTEMQENHAEKGTNSSQTKTNAVEPEDDSDKQAKDVDICATEAETGKHNLNNSRLMDDEYDQEAFELLERIENDLGDYCAEKRAGVQPEMTNEELMNILTVENDFALGE